MQKSLKTNNKEEDEWLEIWLNFVLFFEDTRLEDTPQYDNRLRAIMQTFVEEVLHFISEKNTVWMYINIVFFLGLPLTSFYFSTDCRLNSNWISSSNCFFLMGALPLALAKSSILEELAGPPSLATVPWCFRGTCNPWSYDRGSLQYMLLTGSSLPDWSQGEGLG